MLNITERQTGGVTILDLEGNVIMGGGSAKLREAMSRLMASGKKNILLNFAGVKYMDSSGVGELLSGSTALTNEGGNLKLLNLPKKVEEVMTLSSILSMFEVYETEDQALKKFSGNA